MTPKITANATLRDCNPGTTIVFLAAIEDEECDFDAGMQAKIVYAKVLPDNVLELALDFSEFEDFNKLLMLPNYYDDNGDPTLRWCDTKTYPKDAKETIFLNVTNLPFCVNDTGKKLPEQLDTLMRMAQVLGYTEAVNWLQKHTPQSTDRRQN